MLMQSDIHSAPFFASQVSTLRTKASRRFIPAARQRWSSSAATATQKSVGSVRSIGNSKGFSSLAMRSRRRTTSSGGPEAAQLWTVRRATPLSRAKPTWVRSSSFNLLLKSDPFMRSVQGTDVRDCDPSAGCHREAVPSSGIVASFDQGTLPTGRIGTRASTASS